MLALQRGKIERWQLHLRENTVERVDLLKAAAEPPLPSFHSKGLKTDKLPAHVFEIDEDAKDEVSRRASVSLYETLITAERKSDLLLTHRALHEQTIPCSRDARGDQFS